ncbi:uncharacterized protein LOC118478146 [Aplysia californica]|uniref:Uncharacterized protein LOC118478146 n=1 Tax=Aplysia californica TaxID=6500 RepID=A0ABM1VX60_APLCA|nr:uncharacterized protein LOC118478146 [Aplysia californica]
MSAVRLSLEREPGHASRHPAPVDPLKSLGVSALKTLQPDGNFFSDCTSPRTPLDSESNAIRMRSNSSKIQTDPQKSVDWKQPESGHRVAGSDVGSFPLNMNPTQMAIHTETEKLARICGTFPERSRVSLVNFPYGEVSPNCVSSPRESLTPSRRGRGRKILGARAPPCKDTQVATQTQTQTMNPESQAPDSLLLIKQAVQNFYGGGAAAAAETLPDSSHHDHTPLYVADLKKTLPPVPEVKRSPVSGGPEVKVSPISGVSAVKMSPVSGVSKVKMPPVSGGSDAKISSISDFGASGFSKSLTEPRYNVKTSEEPRDMRNTNKFTQMGASAATGTSTYPKTPDHMTRKMAPSGSGNPSPASNACTCVRSSKLILCQTCGETMHGRVRRVCPVHPSQIFLMDFEFCGKCKCKNLREICSTPRA